MRANASGALLEADKRFLPATSPTPQISRIPRNTVLLISERCKVSTEQYENFRYHA